MFTDRERELMKKAWWSGYWQGHEVGRTETSEGTMDFEDWLEKEEGD